MVDVKPGLTGMEGAVKNNIPGIDADCGDAYAPCRVYIDKARADKTGASRHWRSRCWILPRRRTNSHLSCQIKVSDALDGLIVNAGALTLIGRCARKRAYSGRSISG